MTTHETTAHIIDQSGSPTGEVAADEFDPARDWPPVLIARETIEAEIVRQMAGDKYSLSIRTPARRHRVSIPVCA
jgi:hypothetical protein